MFGCLNLQTKKFYWKSSYSGNTESFIAFLNQLRQNFPDKNLLIIIDNASIHRSKKTKRFLEKHQEITLYHLPTYSPEYNPVEKIWWWIKPKVYGLFAMKDGLKELLTRFRKLVRAYNMKELPKSIEMNLETYKELINIIAD